jgi:thiol-disulfide isomerase/thioredoxin
LLAQQVVREYGDRARFVVEDFGASPLADRFGIDKYPAIIVDDALVAVPEDFYAWGGAGKGKYLPWSDLANRKKFQNDLRRMIDIRLAGGTLRNESRPQGASKAPSLPWEISIADLDGKAFKLADLRGKPLIVEFWAPWCPPCLDTMRWLKKLDPKKANIVALAVESERQAVDKVMANLAPAGRVAMASAEIVNAMGGIPAVPLLFLAGRDGKVVRVFYGAPPDLHAQIEAALARMEN